MFKLYLTLILFHLSFSVGNVSADTRSDTTVVNSSREPIEIEYPEVYELSNIILALTKHGIEDPLEVQKDFDYYKKMRKWFEPYSKHPVIESANFSREQWMEFLSFRTDAYAFAFNEQGRLERTSTFNAFSITTFDDYLEDVEDFANKSKFRDFYAQNQRFRDQIITRYRQTYMLEEMRDFLEVEFGNFFENKRYVVALSPFVGAQNLHRNINETLTVDFPSLARSVIEGKSMSRKEQSRAIHTLFTEMSHGYVNPTTKKYEDIVREGFDPKIWGPQSGYEEYDNAVFNEYMTWAIYDIFVTSLFSESAKQVSFDWHVINESRGFIYSNFFAQELMKFYEKRQSNQKLSDLYSTFVKHLASVQNELTKPIIKNSREVFATEADKHAWVEIVFSEPMSRNSTVSYTIKHEGYEDLSGVLTSENIRWSKDQRSVQLNIAFPTSTNDNYGIMFNNYGASAPFVSTKGVLLKTNSYRLVKAS